MNRTLRDVCLRSVAFEARAAGDGRTLEGYAAVFGTPARIADAGGDFDEVIVPGAFKRSLASRTPVMQWEHGNDPRVGRVPIGAIEELSEDSRGLFVRAKLYDNDVVKPLRQAIAGGSVKGMSFRFSVPQGGDTWTRNGDVDHREIRDADVFELGPVAFPAYDTTTVTVRSMLAGLDDETSRALLRELRRRARPHRLAGQSPRRADGGGTASDSKPRSGPTSQLDYDTLLLMRRGH